MLGDTFWITLDGPIFWAEGFDIVIYEFFQLGGYFIRFLPWISWYCHWLLRIALHLHLNMVTYWLFSCDLLTCLHIDNIGPMQVLYGEILKTYWMGTPVAVRRIFPSFEWQIGDVSLNFKNYSYFPFEHLMRTTSL